ncbi:hypothetical protein E3N88_35822 [Mikania micrantha]|uniref:CTLH domain-containing protein n=1 Tax=Mikania micrantha TaxID=192012 RepID=A0A5N6M2D1_9ASTR|nr:hypothetical protein E3N88_35822 [Mikania micrantha]
MYSYHGGGDIRKHLEVWNAVTGDKQNQFEGHEAPVYSVCPHSKENLLIDYTAPGHSPSIMAYSADGKRLFSCGTNKDGQSFLLDWDESEGVAKRTYSGLIKRANRPVQFDTTKNQYIVAGDEWLVKYWNMDNANGLMAIDAEGDLPASPCVRFNKEGMLLAVLTNGNGIKILANSDGVKVLRAMENRSVDASRNSAKTTSGASANATGGSSNMDIVTTVPPIMNTNSENQNLADRPGIGDKVSDKSTNGKVTEISEPSHCRFLRLPDNTASPMRVTRLMYTNSGLALLALAAHAVHKLWKWPKSDHNSTGKATASVAPLIWQPTSGILMTNDSSGTSTEDSIACFALSNNNSYVTSALGGKISLFNMMTFKTMTTFMPPPPAATFLAFHPQDNNIIAIGMNDSSIQIYNVQIDEVKTKLKGHHKRVTSLAFSSNHNVLASSGADSQLSVEYKQMGEANNFNTQIELPAQSHFIFALKLNDSNSVLPEFVHFYLNFLQFWGKVKVMVSLSRELVFLLLQFLNEEKFKDTAHRLELESGVFFNMRYFEEMITNGEWEEAFKYLSGFTKVEDNQHSTRIFFKMHMQKYFEALDSKDSAKAVEILFKDLKAFSIFSENIFKELALLLTLDNFSLNWQHKQCKEPKLNPDINTLFFDHCCGPSQPNSAHASSLSTNPLLGAVRKPSGLPPLGAHGAAPPPLPPMPSNFPVWIANPAMAHPSSSAGPRGLVPPNIPAILKRPRPRTLLANSPAVAHRTAYTEHASKRPRKSEENSEIQNLADRPGIGDKVSDRSTNGKVTEISKLSHFRFLQLPDNTSSPMRVTRLMYTNSGLALLALAANAVHKLWKWPKSDHNSTGKATASVAPQLWQPTSGIMMTNDISGTSAKDSIACFALLNNSYVTSASGGKISLFNMMTFKTMTTLMPPPPAATFLAFHPQDNNVIAIGMNDSSIRIYNVQIDEVVLIFIELLFKILVET